MMIDPTVKVSRLDDDPWGLLRNLVTGQKQKMLETAETINEKATELLNWATEPG